MAKPPDFLIRIFRIVVVIIVSVSGSLALSDVTCRTSDVESQARECMTDFYSQLGALSSHKFFTGVDVEIIRSVCSQFQESIRCLRLVREQCPRTLSDALVDALIEPHVSLHELCVMPEFYEQYSIHHNCFHRVRSQSDSCWTHFRSTSADLVLEISSPTSTRVTDRRRQVALSQYCGHLKHLQTCVKRVVHNACKKLATNLVDVLVRASVELSPRCSTAAETPADHVTAASSVTSAIRSSDTRHVAVRNFPSDADSTSGVSAMTSGSSWCCRLWCLVCIVGLAVINRL